MKESDTSKEFLKFEGEIDRAEQVSHSMNAHLTEITSELQWIGVSRQGRDDLRRRVSRPWRLLRYFWLSQGEPTMGQVDEEGGHQ
jgi:hypothetical protein